MRKMSRQLLRNPSTLQRAATAVVTSGLPHLEHSSGRICQLQQQCKLPSSVAIRRWKSLLHNNNSAQKPATAATATTASTTATTATATRRCSQAEALNARGSHSPFNAPVRLVVPKNLFFARCFVFFFLSFLRGFRFCFVYFQYIFVVPTGGKAERVCI